MKIKTILQATLLAGLLSAGTTQAADISITGAIDDATGALAALYPPGTTPFTGDLDWNGQLEGVQILLGSDCFTDDASGLPPSSATCGALGVVPILPTGETTYDGTAAAPGASFEQAGSTFDGTSGVLNLLTYSSSFDIFIPISLTFDGSGGGESFADAGGLGTASGAFTVNEVPLPAAAWLFISAIGGLGVIKRFKK